MLQRQAIRIRLLPDQQQRSLMERIAGCCRTIYNLGLDQRRWFARPGHPVSYQSQANEIGELKEAFEWFGEAPYHCLQQALVDLETAYKNFWSGRTGAPKPRKRGVDDSFRYPDPQQVRLEGNLHVADKRRTRSIKQATLKLPKLGIVRCVLHRAIPPGASIASVTVSRDGANWTASVMLEREVQEPKPRLGEPLVGIDLGVSQPVVLSTGQKFEMPRATAGDHEHLARLQRRVTSKKKGSNNRRKAIRRLASFKARQARIRQDALEKVTTEIAKSHGAVSLENLNVRGMTASASGTVEEPGKNVAAKAGLNRSILDVAPGRFRLRLGQKLAASGGVLVTVPAAHTSQRCHKCGDIRPGNRASRDHFLCLACGHSEDADVNAAQNIRDRALGLWGDTSKVEVAASLGLLLAQQAKPKRSFRKKKEQPTGGLPAQACQGRGLHHGTSRKRVAATRPSVPIRGGARSSALQGRE